MLWSILIAAIPDRFASAHGLLHSLLEKQAVMRIADIELCYFMENRRRSVGEKRNDLLRIAKGEYVSFIDDDDEVADDYVRRIYRTITKARKMAPPPDVICFRQIAKLDPYNITHDCRYSLNFWRNRKPAERRVLEPAHDDKGVVVPNVLKWSGPPAHTMVWRREVVKDIAFPETQFGEDVSWVDLACAKAETEIVLDGEPLYTYKFSEKGTATR